MSAPEVVSPLPSVQARLDPGPTSSYQANGLKAVLDLEVAMHATILTIVSDCKRLLDGNPASLSSQDPTFRDLRHTLSHALVQLASPRPDKQACACNSASCLSISRSLKEILQA